MPEKKFLDEVGLAEVATHVNSRLKTVTTMPSTANNGAVRLYVGTDTANYKKGKIYQAENTQYYAWKYTYEEDDYYSYTLSETPQVGDTIYCYALPGEPNCQTLTITEVNSNTVVADENTWTRDASSDVLITNWKNISSEIPIYSYNSRNWTNLKDAVTSHTDLTYVIAYDDMYGIAYYFCHYLETPKNIRRNYEWSATRGTTLYYYLRWNSSEEITETVIDLRNPQVQSNMFYDKESSVNVGEGSYRLGAVKHGVRMYYNDNYYFNNPTPDVDDVVYSYGDGKLTENGKVTDVENEVATITLNSGDTETVPYSSITETVVSIYEPSLRFAEDIYEIFSGENENCLVLYLGESNGIYVKNHVYLVKNTYQEIAEDVSPQFTEMPAYPQLSIYTGVYQYVGETTSKFTKGSFYKINPEPVGKEWYAWDGNDSYNWYTRSETPEVGDIAYYDTTSNPSEITAVNLPNSITISVDGQSLVCTRASSSDRGNSYEWEEVGMVDSEAREIAAGAMALAEQAMGSAPESISSETIAELFD